MRPYRRDGKAECRDEDEGEDGGEDKSNPRSMPEQRCPCRGGGPVYPAGLSTLLYIEPIKSYKYLTCSRTGIKHMNDVADLGTWPHKFRFLGQF